MSLSLDHLLVLVLLAAVGCSDNTAKTDAAAPDATTSDATSDAPTLDGAGDAVTSMDTGSDAPINDSGIDAGPCDLTKPFNAPVLIPGLAGYIANVGSLSPDELTIYFTNNWQTYNTDIYYATRTSVTAAFDGDGGVAPTAIAPVNTNQGDLTPTVTGDGLTMFFASDRPNNMTSYLYTSTRANTNSPWGMPAYNSLNKYLIDTVFLSISPFPDDAGVTSLYYFQNAINFATCQGTTCTNQGTVYVGAGNGVTPAISSDGLTLYFSSDRIQQGNYDIFVGTRADVMQQFGNFAPVNALNSNGTDYPNWISPNGCRMYLSSNRNGMYQMFVASHPL